METFFYKFSVPADEDVYSSPEFYTTFNDVKLTWKVDFSIGELGASVDLSLVAGADNCEVAYSSMLITKMPTNVLMQHTTESMQRGHMYGQFVFADECKRKMKIFADGCFKILVKIIIPRGCFERNNFAKPVDHLVLPENSANELFEQFTGRVRVDGLSDMVLISSDNSKYYCHKFVFSSCSEFFKTEITGKQMRMDDVDGETLTIVLFYMYTGQIMDENKMNLPLMDKCMYAAEKFKLPNLKAKLLSRLKFHLYQDNVLHCLEPSNNFAKPVDHLVLPENSASEMLDQVMGRVPVDKLSNMVLISSDNSKYYCHKFVLYCCSEYFKTEIARNRMHVYDVDGETLSIILYYIYTGELVDENRMNLPLTEKCLSAAEIFKLPNLKTKLLSRLKFHLYQDNVLNCLEPSNNFAKPVDHLVLPENSASEMLDQVMGRVPVDKLSYMVLISSDNSKYYCHKFVLYCCSEYFKTEIARNRMHVYDVDGETLSIILYYIYTGELVDENRMNLPLTEKCLSAAEIFKLPNLKTKLLSRLKFHLDQHNVMHCLVLADEYRCEMLRLACTEIFLLLEDRLNHSLLVRPLCQHIQKKCNEHDPTNDVLVPRVFYKLG